MHNPLNVYYGVFYTSNIGTIIDIDEYSRSIFGVEKKEEAVGRNIVHFIPDYSIEEFYVENQSYNIQLLHSKELIAFSSYSIKSKKVYIKVLICRMSLLNRFFQKLADEDLTSGAVFFLDHVFSDPVREKEPFRQIKAEGVVGTSKEMQELFQLIERVADTDATLLLTGETGVGKSMFARIIHDTSSRKDSPFVEINCAAIHKNLIESELFGYEKGSFTGANTQGKIGKIELSDKGTLFLDEITEIPLEMQQKLLQTIQNKQICPIGSTKNIGVNFRLIAATNRDLEEMVRRGEFREDLYYRINVIPMKIPPIRNRESDIIALVLHFARKNNERYGKTKSFSKEAIQVFCRYNWPGNVRELENLVERMLLTSSGDVIEKKELPIFLQEVDTQAEKKNMRLKDAMEEYEKVIILDAYSKYKTSILVGEKLGIGQTSAARKIRKYLGTSRE